MLSIDFVIYNPLKYFIVLYTLPPPKVCGFEMLTIKYTKKK